MIIKPKSEFVNTLSSKPTGHPIKLKSISEERALNRTVKLKNASNPLLTDHGFENKQIADLSFINSSDYTDSRTNFNQLQLEIALATTRALSSIKDYSPGKIVHRTGIRNQIKPNSSPFIEAKALRPSELNISREFPGKSVPNKKPDTGFAKKTIVASKTAEILEKEPCRCLIKLEAAEEDPRNTGDLRNKISISNRKTLNTLGNKQREHLFIDKIKEATIKLRNLREYSSKLNAIK